MDNLLNPDFGLTFWTLVTFLALVAVLGKFAWKPLIKGLEDRESGIQKSIADAASARQTADELKVRLESELAAAHLKSQGILAEARKDAEVLRAQLLKKAEEDVQRLMAQNKAQLDQDRQSLSRELRQEVGTLAVQIAEKLLRHSMNASENEKLIQNLLADVDKITKVR